MGRIFLAPLKPGSRSPEEFRAAVTAALDEEDEDIETNSTTPTPIDPNPLTKKGPKDDRSESLPSRPKP
jgi:hypothetical protein